MLLAAEFEKFTIEKITSPLVLFGFVAQAVFMGRFVVQWYMSERRGESYIPISFWYWSIVGAVMLLCYSWMRGDPVFVAAQALGIVIYVRNLMLIRRNALRARRGFPAEAPAQ